MHIPGMFIPASTSPAWRKGAPAAHGMGLKAAHSVGDQHAQGSPPKGDARSEGTGDGVLHGIMLFHLSQMLSACLAEPHARLLRLLMAMHSLVRAGSITKEELQFGLEVLRCGPSALQVRDVDVCCPLPLLAKDTCGGRGRGWLNLSIDYKTGAGLLNRGPWSTLGCLKFLAWCLEQALHLQ
eukprot:1156184-Pelagomonas_calceolata.AAC.1